jgi:thiamine pyrophosphate-dependent acetolactate synthase large subunit-like protein
MYLFQENLRYDKMVEGLGARGEYVYSPGDLRPALKRAYDAGSKERISTLTNVQGLKDFTSAQNYAPGISVEIRSFDAAS